MIALLRSSTFVYPDGSEVVVEVRRVHDEHAHAANKEFIFTRRLPAMRSIFKRSFGTPREALRYHDEQLSILADQGLRRRDAFIMGFREEG